MRIRRAPVALGALLLASAGCINPPAPRRPAPQPGQRVRVAVRNGHPSRFTGTVVAFTADSLVLRADGAGSDSPDSPRPAFAQPAVRRIELSRGVHSAWPAGITTGSGVGLVVAMPGFTQGKWWAGDATSLAVVGGCAVAGAVIGWAVRVERWRRIR